MTKTAFTTSAAPSGTATFSAPDISCGGCANAIRRALGAVDGIGEITVDVAAKTVTVTPTGTVAPETILATLDRAGFPATRADAAPAAEAAAKGA